MNTHRLDGWQEWNKAAELAQAFNIGKMESEAAFHLLRAVDEPVTQSLSVLVKSLEALS